MRTLTVKGIPDKLYKRLRQSAIEHRRTVSGEVITCLERSLLAKRMDPDEFLGRVEALRDRLALPPLTDDFLRAAKIAGRP